MKPWKLVEQCSTAKWMLPWRTPSYVDNGRCQGKGRCGARMAFSLRATGIKAARPAVAQPGKDAA